MSYTIEVEDKIYTVEISSIAIANTYSRDEVDSLIASKANISTLNSHTSDTTIHFTQSNISLVSSQISDFATSVSNNAAVAANTLKISNATHTGDVTGATALTIANKQTLTASNGVNISNTPTVIAASAPAITLTYGTAANTVCQGNDSRLSDARTPIAHLHVETDLTLADNTTNNASTTKHGFLQKLNGSTSNYLRGDGSWSTPPNTTYTEISEAEIDAGTASTGRTITGRRSKYMLDKCAPVVHTHSQYALVTVSTSAPSSAPTMVGAIYINTTQNRFYIAVGTASTSDWRGVLTQ